LILRLRESAPGAVAHSGNKDSDRIANHIRITGNHMDSINQQQPEQTRLDLSGAKAVEKMKQLVDKAETCFFCTGVTSNGGTRPMSVQEVDDQGNLWFLSADDSHKNEELTRDPSVRLYFQGSAHSDFLMLNGAASVSRDKTRIKELWEPIIKTWFTEGEDDPRITVIKVRPTDGYYWDTKHGAAIAGAKMLVGAAIGKTLDDSVEGQLVF
jgi:general stress protein 26